MLTTCIWIGFVLQLIWMLSNFHYNIPFVCTVYIHFDFVASVFGIVCYGAFSLCYSIHFALSLLYLKYHFRCCIANGTCCMHFTHLDHQLHFDRNVCEKLTERWIQCGMSIVGRAFFFFFCFSSLFSLYSLLFLCALDSISLEKWWNSNLIWFWWCFTVKRKFSKESLIERKSPKTIETDVFKR